MESRLVVVLCLISVVGICAVGIAGNLDKTVGNADGMFCTDSVSLELEAAVGFPARVEKTGNTTSYGPRDDGKLRKGVAWPNPRFKDKGNGTVRDNLTGLIWLKDANCVKFWAVDQASFNYRNWRSALAAANNLGDGACGLTDGSKAGNWRLPNVKELQSLIHYGFDHPALPNTAGTGQWTEGDPFLGVQSSTFWSSTSYPYPGFAWVVDFYNGGMNKAVLYTDIYYVWPVRGPQ